MSLLHKLNNSFGFSFYLFWKLPAAWFMGVSVENCDHRACVIRLPYRWRSQNPFRSIYFAAQCAAGELSTGLLALLALEGKPPVSMLVRGAEAEFFKKADQTLRFTCTDGEAVNAAVQAALTTNQPQTLSMTSIGRLPDGTEAARVVITWSFKAKV